MDKDEKSEGRTQIYELGYHIVPTVPENDLPSEVSALTGVILEKGGIMISDERPMLRPLAYTLYGNGPSGKAGFNNAYFGWVKFEAPIGEIKAIEAEVAKNQKILRFLLVKTVRESTLYGARIAQNAKMQGGERKPEAPAAAAKPKMTEAEMDKTIDELVKE